MKKAFAKTMIRQSPHGPDRFRFRGILALALMLSSPVFAEDMAPPGPANADWCNCQAIQAAEDEALREHLLAEAREQQAQCRESLGVSMEQQRKGQGARLDACRCSCLEADAEPREGPWGDQKKPARQGR
jgi:hypothetical protein